MCMVVRCFLALNTLGLFWLVGVVDVHKIGRSFYVVRDDNCDGSKVFRVKGLPIRRLFDTKKEHESDKETKSIVAH